MDQHMDNMIEQTDVFVVVDNDQASDFVSIDENGVFPDDVVMIDMSHDEMFDVVMIDSDIDSDVFVISDDDFFMSGFTDDNEHMSDIIDFDDSNDIMLV